MAVRMVPVEFVFAWLFASRNIGTRSAASTMPGMRRSARVSIVSMAPMLFR
ncbi:hypothetical protein [Clavibacter tessellarius]|uniref:hypothetical protein n=1 Tax=Clavibacter tessellarius TaxID=31965 RepID=UPI0039EC5827